MELERGEGLQMILHLSAPADIFNVFQLKIKSAANEEETLLYGKDSKMFASNFVLN